MKTEQSTERLLVGQYEDYQNVDGGINVPALMKRLEESLDVV